MIDTVNPATEELLSRYAEHPHGEVVRRLARAWTGWESWRDSTFSDRSRLLRALADRFDTRREELARRATQEMGKPIGESRSELEKCAWLCRHYADHGEGYLAPEQVDTEAVRSFVRFESLGPILAIMPWNFPYWQVLRHGVPALTAGNVILLKHAPNVTGVALAIEELLREAGFPEAVLQTLVISPERTDELIADQRICGVTLTGSVGAGRAVAAAAGSHIKKSVLELGGSDPFVVLDDADLDHAVAVGVQARMQNSGQSCIAAKRFVVQAPLYHDFVEGLRDGMTARRIGDPLDEDTQLGPIAREDLRDRLHDQVQRAVKDGATLVCGGEPLDRPGYFYPATVLVDLTPANPGAHEELFGPVAAVFRVADDEEALAIANATPYGLGASVWTRDLDRGQRIAARVQAGAVTVNELVKSDPRLPFGGVKDSGYGRELGQLGAREFTNAKTVWVGRPGADRGGLATD